MENKFVLLILSLIITIAHISYNQILNKTSSLVKDACNNDDDKKYLIDH